jgi:hypothetical protein
METLERVDGKLAEDKRRTSNEEVLEALAYIRFLVNARHGELRDRPV